jgi:SAM-dependent methyltransferase
MNFGTKQVEKDAADYNSLFSDRSGTGDVKARQDNYMTLVNGYYNLVTDFYEWGWGKSFHFGRRYAGEDLSASIARHEHYLALQANFQKGQNIIDVGCGVGGPMRAIARFSGCNVIGINNNAYQISRGIKHVSSICLCLCLLACLLTQHSDLTLSHLFCSCLVLSSLFFVFFFSVCVIEY